MESDKKIKPISWLVENISKDNLVPDLDSEVVARIGQNVVSGYDADNTSRADWEKKTEDGLKVARQEVEFKNYPWPKAANVKYPLIATAAIQFASRAYPQIVKGHDVVKAEVIGIATDDKVARAKRVSTHMSYQLLHGMPEWETDTDLLLTMLPVTGTVFRKTYYDVVTKKPRSISISPLDLVVNQDIKSLDTARRITEKLWLYKNDVIEREASGIFSNNVSEKMHLDDETDKQELFLEQHTWIDLDGDGYREPYIATVHHESQTVARIVARYDENGVFVDADNESLKRIEAVQYYTAFKFLPDPAGKYMGMGFAHLLGPINETINTAINQLLDAGHLANVQGGFKCAGARIKGGVITIKPGQWQDVDVMGGTLKDNLVPYPIKEPSPVLFQLLGLLTEAGLKLASVSDTMTGEMPGQNTPATTVLAVIDQNLKVFSSIYKRVFKSLKDEYKKLFRLNRLYLAEAEYVNILDERQAVVGADYDTDDLDISPVADPTISSEAQRLTRAQAILNTLSLNPVPEGKVQILAYYYEAIGVPDVNRFLPAQKVVAMLNAPQPPNPAIIDAQLKATDSMHRFELEAKKARQAEEEGDAKNVLTMAQARLAEAQAAKTMAEADAIGLESKFEPIRQQINALDADLKLATKRFEALNKIGEMAKNGQRSPEAVREPDARGVPGVEGKPDNQKNLGDGQNAEAELPGEPGVGPNAESGVGGENGVADLQGDRDRIRAEFGLGNESGTGGGIEG